MGVDRNQNGEEDYSQKTVEELGYREADHVGNRGKRGGHEHVLESCDEPDESGLSLKYNATPHDDGDEASDKRKLCLPWPGEDVNEEEDRQGVQYEVDDVERGSPDRQVTVKPDQGGDCPNLSANPRQSPAPPRLCKRPRAKSASPKPRRPCAGTSLRVRLLQPR